jgi:hypothetical protein
VDVPGFSRKRRRRVERAEQAGWVFKITRKNDAGWTLFGGEARLGDGHPRVETSAIWTGAHYALDDLLKQIGQLGAEVAYETQRAPLAVTPEE